MDPSELELYQKFYFDPKELIERCSFNKKTLRMLFFENYLTFFSDIADVVKMTEQVQLCEEFNNVNFMEERNET